LGRKRIITSGTKPNPSELALFESARAFGSHAACFFNNKGGVGKTTLVANLAAELALNFGAKILVVDGDPQCNLTQYVLRDEDSLEIYGSADPSSVYSVIRPLSLGKGYGDSLPVKSSSNFGFDVIIVIPDSLFKRTYFQMIGETQRVAVCGEYAQHMSLPILWERQSL
jgi:cellulose biosynthesis protein BcsQ